jgi:ABC-type dipeptide/oligopeptide/nickel transport system permease subunit
MTSRIPFVIAILTLICGVFISIIFGANEDYFKDKIKEGLSKMKRSILFRMQRKKIQY